MTIEYYYDLRLIEKNHPAYKTKVNSQLIGKVSWYL